MSKKIKIIIMIIKIIINLLILCQKNSQLDNVDIPTTFYDMMTRVTCMVHINLLLNFFFYIENLFIIKFRG